MSEALQTEIQQQKSQVSDKLVQTIIDVFDEKVITIYSSPLSKNNIEV